ncbi:MAG TPA: lysylphosphatidylglycerol synthase transmembrane domain-containing protein [Vicinamibacteria bacterium]|nr:lysylphosphatidylglycerol synthase transmembrane domain-containing protein [Vicinamibacteria bacterium]
MKRLLHHAAQLAPALLALGLLAWVLRSADLGKALDLVRALGPWLPLLLVPNLLAIVSEASGWWLAFARLGPRPRWFRLVSVRVIGDALMLGLPSGSVVSETVQPWLLKRRCGVPTEHGIVATVARKFFVVLSHGLFLAAATILAWPLLERASRSTIGRVGLPVLLLTTALVLVTVALLLLTATALGQVADRLRRGLDRLVGRWMGAWLERNALRFQRTDDALARFFRRPWGLWPSVLLYLLGWFIRSLETLLFLRLVGVDAPLGAAMVIETALILVRAMAVPVPAGLGVQDLGYVLSLRALGVPDPTTVGAAFVLLKRGKDAFWVAAGFLLLSLGRRAGAPLIERSR